AASAFEFLYEEAGTAYYKADDGTLITHEIDAGATGLQLLYADEANRVTYYRTTDGRILEATQYGGNLSNAPDYDWWYGCSPTSAGMMMGYYDISGYGGLTYPNLVPGGTAELNSFPAGTYIANNAIASSGHIADYWTGYGNSGDPCSTCPSHTLNSLADFMCTSDYTHCSNTDGGSTFYTWNSGARFTHNDAVSQGITQQSGMYGIGEYVQYAGYSYVNNSLYNQKISTALSSYFSWTDYKSEIDAGRPTLIHITGHTMLAYGYTDPNTVYVHDTWSAGAHTMTWGGTYSSSQHQSMTCLQVSGGSPPGGGCTDVNDGSFENGPPAASAWTEWTSTACEWITDPSSAWGISAYDGTYAFWAGGYCSGTPNSGYVQQSISVPAGATNLKFWTNFNRTSADDASANDYFYVKINGAAVFTRPMTQANNTFPNWTRQSVNISAYAGTTVTLRFEGVSVGDGVADFTGNVLVDDVTICTGDAAEGDELAVSFSGGGVWHYDHSSTTWAGIGGPAQDLENYQGELATDFGAGGLWLYDGSWAGIGGNPQAMETCGSALYADFGGTGLWRYDGSWSGIGSNPDDLQCCNGALYVDYGASGLWRYDGSWSGLAGNPTGMWCANGDLYANLPGGLWKYDGSWSGVGGTAQGVEGCSGNVYVDYGTSGLWKYDGGWSGIGGNPQSLQCCGGTLFVDYGGSGLWQYNGAWSGLSGDTDDMCCADALYVDFAGGGLWRFDGTWTGLASDTTVMTDVDINP
ncbi:MAG: hypothetical protein GY849_15635, partial [Deltaproteobacteria bacterium]|nr:hypothetical protein [Deltaproteobacteria bacterium]